MELSTFVIADHAEAVNGKLYLVGGAWNRISATALPVVHHHLSVAVVLHVPWEAANQHHQIELRLVDADGQAMIPEPIHGQLETGRPPHLRTGDEQMVVLCFNLNSLRFESAGTYEFRFLVDGAEMGQLSFQVALVDTSG
jgi:hypothetical protein